MTPDAWLGLVLGAVIGLGYGLWQRRALGAGPMPETAGKTSAWAIIRLTTLLVAVWLALKFTTAHRLWLVVGIMAAYGVLLLAMLLKKK